MRKSKYSNFDENEYDFRAELDELLEAREVVEKRYGAIETFVGKFIDEYVESVIQEYFEKHDYWLLPSLANGWELSLHLPSIPEELWSKTLAIKSFASILDEAVREMDDGYEASQPRSLATLLRQYADKLDAVAEKIAAEDAVLQAEMDR